MTPREGRLAVVRLHGCLRTGGRLHFLARRLVRECRPHSVSPGRWTVAERAGPHAGRLRLPRSHRLPPGLRRDRGRPDCSARNRPAGCMRSGSHSRTRWGMIRFPTVVGKGATLVISTRWPRRRSAQASRRSTGSSGKPGTSGRPRARPAGWSRTASGTMAGRCSTRTIGRKRAPWNPAARRHDTDL